VQLSNKRYYEVHPGLPALAYLLKYSGVTYLGKLAQKRGGMRMFVELASNIDRHIITEGAFERGVLDLLRDVCTETGHTDLMIDIGANIGNHSIGLQSVFNGIEAVEPHPVLFHVLMANKLRNGVAKMNCHNFGLAGVDTTATLTESIENHGLSRVRERSVLSAEVFGLSEESFGEEYAIELKSADAFVGQFAPRLSRSFIKIDVEGMEQEIIEALLPLIREHRPLVGFEWFTKSQPKLSEIATTIPGYGLYGIKMHDHGKNYLLRSFKMLFSGRAYTLEKIDPANLDDVYPLALMIPDKA
jgi:FkbM family methyltransferase